MPLYDQIVRAERRARRQNESTFDYMNSSTRTGICAIRELLEHWFEHLQDDAKADIRARFRSRDEVQHQSAWCELFWHELLRCGGHDPEIHPTVANVTTNPDFLAQRNEISRFPGDSAADRRLAELHDTLDRMNSPDYFIEFQYRGSLQSNIRGRALRARLERWLAELNYEEIAAAYRSLLKNSQEFVIPSVARDLQLVGIQPNCGFLVAFATRNDNQKCSFQQAHRDQNYGVVPTFNWCERGLALTFTPLPKGPDFRGQRGARPVGMIVPMEMRMLHTHDDIRAALEGKATKYGALDLPLVVAVNILDDFYDDIDLWNALFGEEQLLAVRQADGQWRDEWGPRVPNGAWRGRNGPRNTLISAVVITHQLSPSNLRNRAVELIHNPWAAHPLPHEALHLTQRTVALQNGRVDRQDGTGAADLIGVPEPWPVPDGD